MPRASAPPSSASLHGFDFPSNETYRAQLMSRNMYRFKHRDVLLERLKNHGHRETEPL